jgi:hypothetical protein
MRLGGDSPPFLFLRRMGPGENHVPVGVSAGRSRRGEGEGFFARSFTLAICAPSAYEVLT